MTPKTKTRVLVALGTAFALLAYWQTGEMMRQPEIVPLVALEAATFGLGVAFAVGAGPAMRGTVADPRSARLAHLSVSWILLTWALHDTLDLHFGVRALDLVLSQHAYHVTLIAAGAGVAQYVVRLLRERAPAAPAA